VAAQAATIFCPEGQALRSLDARFAGPLLPGQELTLGGEVKAKDDGSHRVTLAPAHGETTIIKPAVFTFAPASSEWPRNERIDITPDPSDVVGDAFTLSSQDIADYRALVTPAGVTDAAVPPMACLLGMTDALAKAFGSRKPPRPGSWVHLRQQGDFHLAIEADTPYVCRIQEGRAVVRNSNVGFQVVLNFVVERPADGALVATGVGTLMYLFDRDSADA